jgi:hypothetical protein
MGSFYDAVKEKKEFFLKGGVDKVSRVLKEKSKTKEISLSGTGINEMVYSPMSRYDRSLRLNKINLQRR